MDLLGPQRKLLNDMNHSTEFGEKLIQNPDLTDLEEFKMKEKRLDDLQSNKSTCPFFRLLLPVMKRFYYYACQQYAEGLAMILCKHL